MDYAETCWRRLNKLYNRHNVVLGKGSNMKCIMDFLNIAWLLSGVATGIIAASLPLLKKIFLKYIGEHHQTKIVIRNNEGIKLEIAGDISQEEIQKLITSLQLSNDKENENNDKSIKVEGDINKGAIITHSKNIVFKITEGIDQNALNKKQSVEYKEMGRSKVQAWGEQLSLYNKWNWELLGQSIEYYVDSIKYDPDHQHPWTNLAYVYHLIGEKNKANECLSKAKELAQPGPNFPGGNYKQVEKAIKKDSTISGNILKRPSIPLTFRQKYEKFL